MTDVWLQAHDDVPSYHVSSLIRCIYAETNWDAQADTERTLCQLAELELEIDNLTRSLKDKHKRLDAILDGFYTQWLFSGSSQKTPEYLLNSVCYALSMRSGTSTALAIILVHLLCRAELEAEVALVEGEVMVHVTISDDEGYVIEPNSGHQSWYITPENTSDEQQDTSMERLIGDESFKLYLSQQKWAFIAAEKFSHALSCVELLMELLGDDDPYERRDRGYLLNQINCPNMAKEDLQFFIDECPDDPATELIQHQIKELTNFSQTLH